MQVICSLKATNTGKQNKAGSTTGPYLCPVASSPISGWLLWLLEAAARELKTVRAEQQERFWVRSLRLSGTDGRRFWLSGRPGRRNAVLSELPCPAASWDSRYPCTRSSQTAPKISTDPPENRQAQGGDSRSNELQPVHSKLPRLIQLFQ